IYIKEYRKRKNLTQAELAERLGVHENTLRRWENGEFDPRSNDLLKLCEVLGCTESELLNGSGQQEFEVKILMGVKSLTGLAGAEVLDNTFFYGVEDGKPQIHIAGRVNIGTPEERKTHLMKLSRNLTQLAGCSITKARQKKMTQKRISRLTTTGLNAPCILYLFRREKSMKTIDNINIKWREIVRRIYGLNSEVEDAMNDGLDSVSSTKSR
ncbi:MAG: helix-turn-helix transcriptional regulator, partial [Synergistaceae bacterium]|nr:helix-turn-helix transcriptional regulator [Synergistaceae bacterium]